MKKIIKVVLLILVIGAIGGYIWWQQNKKKIIRNAIETAIKKKTDSLYTVRYDSSKIDELLGNASFFNVSLQSDSAQKELLSVTDSLPNSLILIKVREVRLLGVDVPGLMQNTNINAKKIVLDKPVIQIINTGAGNDKPYSAADTLELYQRILGKFNSIKVGDIQIDSGHVIITDRKGKSLTTVENINISLKNFLVDNEHNYNNIISYFIKDVTATIDNIQLPEGMNRTRMNITKLRYDAIAKTVTVKQIQQYKTGNAAPVIELNNIGITKLNTDAFVLHQQLKAGTINCDGGLITIYKREKQSKNKSIEFSTDFDAIQIDSMNLEKTRIIIIDETDPASDHIVLNDVRFNMTNGLKVSEGNTLAGIMSYANWKLSSSGFSISTKDKLYRVDARGVEIDNIRSGISIERLAIVPVLSEQEFVRQSSHQRDRYDMIFTNIRLNDVNFKRLIADNALEANSASLQAVLKVFNDRTVPVDSSSKVGKAPYQVIMKLKMPIYISRVQVSNSLIEYKERAAISEKTGAVSFTNVNGIIENVTNIPERIGQNGTMKFTATARFLGVANMSTTWLMPLTAGNGNFRVSGNLGSMNAVALNRLIEPLGMASVTSGIINRTEIMVKGNDHKATGNVLLTYKDLKIKLLKKDDNGGLKKKGLNTILANVLIKNDNPSKGEAIRELEVENDRELNKSFFNLLWKTIYKGVKKTATGKKN